MPETKCEHQRIENVRGGHRVIYCDRPKVRIQDGPDGERRYKTIPDRCDKFENEDMCDHNPDRK
jgi:hypothetical protein